MYAFLIGMLGQISYTISRALSLTYNYSLIAVLQQWSQQQADALNDQYGQLIELVVDGVSVNI